jgi:kynureninase
VITRDRTVPIEAFGGFLALRTRHAARLQAALRRRGVLTDHRGEVLRLGPAPYLSDRQLEAAVAALAEALGEVRQG